MKKKHLLATLCMTMAGSMAYGQKAWTLQECLDYALANNIQLQQKKLTVASDHEDVLQSKSALFPSVSFSTNQNASWRPFAESTINLQGGTMTSSKNEVSYNGSYGINANWTVWNGNRNYNTIKLNALATQEAEQDSIANARDLEEKIATLYIQILYSKEAVKVQKESLEAAKVNEQRGLHMVQIGSMSKAECSQLSATRAQDEYNVVQAESNVLNYKRQLKALLEIIDDDDFDVADTEATDAMALQPIPSLQSVYDVAKANRPEIKRALLAVQSAELQQKIACAGHYPTVSLNASAGTSSASLNTNSWGEQMKSNFSIGAGVTVSVPLFDQRSSRTATNKANIQRQSALLDVQNEEVALHNTIENYWIDANSNQNQYKAAKISTTAAQDSYDLLSEQFAVGLKDIVELQDGKTRLLSAKQSELQAKYMTVLDIKMLELYKRQ